VLLGSSVDAGVWVAVISLGATIIGGAIVMAWRLGGLDTSVKGLGRQMEQNTGRLDVIEAKADAAKETATAAVAAANAVASSVQRRRTDIDWGGAEHRGGPA